MTRSKLRDLFACLILLGLLAAPPVSGQTAPCGVVDAIDYPLDISETLSERYDDFGLFRQRFGGLHVAMDIAFNRRGESIYAAARGQVTYSNPEGWDTEKGVVIVRHIFPDQSIAYTLYGHVEQTDTLRLPPVGSCVERGQPIAAVGWPSRGLPHLHYEIRDFMPDDGGPGYVNENPLTLGWYHPLDFTLSWRARLEPGYLGSVTFETPATLPPVLLDNGELVVASGDLIEAVDGTGNVLWRVTMPGAVMGLSGLPGGRVAAHARGGQAVVLQTGRYLAVWQVEALEVSLQTIADTLYFALADGGLAAYSSAGALLWQIAGTVAPFSERAAELIPAPGLTSAQIGLSVRGGDGVRALVVNSDGSIAADVRFNRNDRLPALAHYSGGWLALVGPDLVRLTDAGAQPITAITPTPGRAARLTVGPDGTAYGLLDDREGTLIAVGTDGAVLWRTEYPWRGMAVTPLVRADDRDCAVYTLDMDGVLRAFGASDGQLLGERQLYAGGVRNGSPLARVLRAEGGRVLVGAGFLSLTLFDAAALTEGRCVG